MSDVARLRRVLVVVIAVTAAPVLMMLPILFIMLAGVGVDDGIELDVVTRPNVPLPKIDPSAPLADLLPTPPKATPAPVYLGDNLESVPELMLETMPKAEARTNSHRKRKGHLVAAALHLNGKQEDGFLKALLSRRPDLSGLAFLMGDDCRMKDERKRAFKDAAETARQRSDALLAEATEPGSDERQNHWLAHTAVTAQILPGEDTDGRLRRLRTLASIPRPEATRELARLAVFACEESVRAQAIEALSVRREADSTAVLVSGLSYPWPAAAKNATVAIAKLKRKDLTPHLVKMLDAPDPRGPRTEEDAGRKVTVAHELVRINHLRNCLLCHAPVERDKSPEDTLVAEVPVAFEALPDTSNGYGQSESNLLVRIDVTYLRQDFSATMAVAQNSLWPMMQRFDFVVRKRVLRPAEADDLVARLKKREKQEGSPYRRAARLALSELTGRDFDVNGEGDF